MSGESLKLNDFFLLSWKACACPRKCGLVEPYINVSLILDVFLGEYIQMYMDLYSKHISDVLTSSMLGRSPIKWKRRSNMTIAVDWAVKPRYTVYGIRYTLFGIRYTLYGHGGSHRSCTCFQCALFVSMKKVARLVF